MMHDVMADTWAATDALGRTLPGPEVCGPPRADRFVGVFYFILHGLHGQEGPYDVTKMLAANPENPGFEPGKAYFWGEPEHGYYLATDRWVIRRNAYMLSDAGVDTLIFDTTNDHIYPETLTALCETYRQICAEGEHTPDICFLASKESIRLLWEHIYARRLYEELWFRWQGKPLLLFGQHVGMPHEQDLPGHIRAFFTLRASWAWDSLPWYGDGGYHRWPWVAHYPQPVGWDQPGDREMAPVAIGQHPLSGIGRSFHDGVQPETDDQFVTPMTGEGLHFAEQWRRALEVDPQFLFITGWNEWTAGGVRRNPEDTDESLHRHWAFFPGARMTRAGKPLKTGDVYFIDQFNREFSRDAEPMAGGHTDNYYYQMIDGIRRYKGVRSLPPASAPISIDIHGSWNQWETVQPEYRDHLFDTLHRDEPGWGAAGRLINTTGRNEIFRCQVARDPSNLYFLVETREPLTPHTDHNWMMLFLQTANAGTPRWEGFDYLVNWPVIDARTTTVKRCLGGWNWTDVATAPMRVEGHRLMVQIPRAVLGLSVDPIDLQFKWADNLQELGRIEAFFTQGDCAPPRRFTYRYQA